MKKKIIQTSPAGAGRLKDFIKEAHAIKDEITEDAERVGILIDLLSSKPDNASWKHELDRLTKKYKLKEQNHYMNFAEQYQNSLYHISELIALRYNDWDNLSNEVKENFKIYIVNNPTSNWIVYRNILYEKRYKEFNKLWRRNIFKA